MSRGRPEQIEPSDWPVLRQTETKSQRDRVLALDAFFYFNNSSMQECRGKIKNLLCL